MRESSHMHAVMLDTFPPIMYLNDVSREIIYAVHDFNAEKGAVVAGYTFDAGPNAHVYTVERYAGELEKMLGGIAGVQKTMVCRPGTGRGSSAGTRTCSDYCLLPCFFTSQMYFPILTGVTVISKP